ncbi:MAG: hypothetical protein HYZ42_09385 [Bacteroidetes bacterium]|nr:hypothetical protein [Bacteroidota bacterium]
MLKPNFWFILISEFAVGGLCIYFFYKFFLQPNAKNRAEEMEERMKRYDEMLKAREEDKKNED